MVGCCLKLSVLFRAMFLQYRYHCNILYNYNEYYIEKCNKILSKHLIILSQTVCFRLFYWLFGFIRLFLFFTCLSRLFHC